VTFNVDQDVEEGVALVAASGELDLASVDELRTALRTAATTTPSQSVVVDVSDVSFIDSTALAALLRSNDELSSNGVQMVMACPPGPVRRLLTMTSLDDRLILAPDRPGALAQARRS
jgi:anti-sigma B factor antagonist